MSDADSQLASLSAYLQRHAVSAPSSEATVGDGERLSYAQLESVVESLCIALHRCGLRAGHRLAFLGSPSPAFWAVLLAASRMKLLWLGMNPAYSARELAHVLRDSAPMLICVDATVAAESRGALQRARELATAAAPVVELQRGARGALDALRDFGATIVDDRDAISIPEDAGAVLSAPGDDQTPAPAAPEPDSTPAPESRP